MKAIKGKKGLARLELVRMRAWLKSLTGGKAVVGIPYFWLLIYFLLPFFIVLRISVAEMEMVTFKDLLTYVDGSVQLKLKLSNYIFIAEDPLYFKTYLNSLMYAAVTTVMCLFIGYPFAYFMARAKPHHPAHFVDAGHVAVLDLVLAARLRVEGFAQRRWLGF